MSKYSRTLLKEHKPEGAENPLERGCYSVIAGRPPGMGGCESDKIEARIVNNYYLITQTETWKRQKCQEKMPLAIIDKDKPQEAAERMYQEAKRIAKERAKLDKNRVIDLTSRVKNIPKEAEHYT